MQAQLSLFAPEPKAQISTGSVEVISQYRDWRLAGSAAEATIATEVSQLRMLARSAERIHAPWTLRDLCAHPVEAAGLIEDAAGALSVQTVRARVAAFTRLLRMVGPEGVARARIERLRAAFPTRPSRGWHDAGVWLPGKRSRIRLPGPTPGPGDLEAIVRAGAELSPAHGATAAFSCFSGCEAATIVGLRWRDLAWHDEGTSSFWVAQAAARGRANRWHVVGSGAQVLLRWALDSTLDKDSFVFPGRAAGTHITPRAFAERCRAALKAGGWPLANRAQLIGALAMWLREGGLDDHAARIVLGRRRVASVDRLTRVHAKIGAQLAVDAALVARDNFAVSWYLDAENRD